MEVGESERERDEEEEKRRVPKLRNGLHKEESTKVNHGCRVDLCSEMARKRERER